jgi:DNA polymerase-3 subunit beta
MKVIAQTAALQEALGLAGSIVASRTPKPVLQCVKLMAADDLLTVLATDLEVGCRYQVAAVQVEQEGEALVPADRLIGIVRESADDESLTIETEKQTVHVTGAGSHFKVFGYDPGEYPAVADFAEPGDFQVAAGALAGMIGKTLFATAKAHSHYAISGVLWEASGKKLQLVATDGHRLAQAKGSLAKSISQEVTAIVPAKLMGLIQRVASDGEEMLEVKIVENQILLRTARAVLVSSLVQGNFPKYADVIPQDCTRKAVLNTGQFEHRLRQAALLANEESQGVRLSFQADQLLLSSRAPEAGEAEVTCPMTFEGDPLDMGFNPSFLIDALRVIGTDEISFELSAANKPAVVKSASDFLYVLMPVDLG